MKGATVIKVEKNKDYTIVSNKFLRDKTLSLKSKGFLTLVIALSNNLNWDFTVEGLISEVKEGETAIRSSIRELKEKGYCKVTLIRDEKAKIIRGEYTFYETKQKALVSET